MPRKRKVTRKRLGKGFFGDMWDGIKSVGRTAAGILPINDILKGTHAISTGLAFVPGIGPIASGLARTAGYGRKKRKVRRVKLGGFVMSPNMVYPLVGEGRRRKRRGGQHMSKTMLGGSNLAF